MTMIEVEGLRVVHDGAGNDEVVALAGLDLVVPEGSVTAVVGPSGAGKSTLLQAVAGLVRPAAGDVRLGGRSVVDLPPEKRDLGVVFQSYALFPHLDVAANVAFGLEVRGVAKKEARQRVVEVLERLEIDRLATRRPHQLSGGERQRVALARALAFGPRALLLDEPLAALDARLRLTLRADLRRRLRDAGVTALYVTHDQEEAMEVGERLAVLRDGRLEQAGSAEALYRRPTNGWVARFFGVANLLDGTVEAAARRFTLRDGASIELSPEAFEGAPGPSAGPARLLVRPEGFRVVDPSASESSRGVIRGRVVDSTFLGARRRLRVSWSNGAQGSDEGVDLQVDIEPSRQVSPGDPIALDVVEALVLPVRGGG